MALVHKYVGDELVRIINIHMVTKIWVEGVFVKAVDIHNILYEFEFDSVKDAKVGLITIGDKLDLENKEV